MNTDKATILIIDDIEDNIEILTDPLLGLYNVLSAANGEEALNLIAKTKPDLILLDIMMPGMNGYEVIRKLKESAATINIPVIFITSKDESVDEEFGFSLGASDYITKPINPSIVLARVKTHLTLYVQQIKLEQQNTQLQKVVRVLENKLVRFGPITERRKVVRNPKTVKQAVNYNLFFLDEHQQEMCELIEEVDDNINTIISCKTIEADSLNNLAELLSQYALILTHYPVLRKLGDGILDFVKVLNEEELHPTQENWKYAQECLESFIYTLQYWHYQLFEKSLNIINLFDNSMQADIHTVIMALQNNIGTVNDKISKNL